MGLCKYRDALGEPGKGVHKHVLGIAMFDLIGTIAVCMGLSRIFHWNFWVVFTIAILSGIILHRMFCVNTTVNQLIFGHVA